MDEDRYHDDFMDRDEFLDRIEKLQARAERLRARLSVFEVSLPGGRYALVLEAEGFEFLMDPLLLRMPPRVLVRRGAGRAEVWLDEDDVSLTRPSDFNRFEERRLLGLVRTHLEELRDAWFNLREDERRDRLGRNLLVD